MKNKPKGQKYKWQKSETQICTARKVSNTISALGVKQSDLYQ